MCIPLDFPYVCGSFCGDLRICRDHVQASGRQIQETPPVTGGVELHTGTHTT